MKIKPKSTQSQCFYWNIFMPKLKKLRQTIENVPFTIFIWRTHEKELFDPERIKEKFNEKNINVITYPLTNKPIDINKEQEKTTEKSEKEKSKEKTEETEEKQSNKEKTSSESKTEENTSEDNKEKETTDHTDAEQEPDKENDESTEKEDNEEKAEDDEEKEGTDSTETGKESGKEDEASTEKEESEEKTEGDEEEGTDDTHKDETDEEQNKGNGESTKKKDGEEKDQEKKEDEDESTKEQEESKKNGDSTDQQGISELEKYYNDLEYALNIHAKEADLILGVVSCDAFEKSPFLTSSEYIQSKSLIYLDREIEYTCPRQNTIAYISEKCCGVRYYNTTNFISEGNMFDFIDIFRTAKYLAQFKHEFIDPFSLYKKEENTIKVLINSNYLLLLNFIVYIKRNENISIEDLRKHLDISGIQLQSSLNYLEENSYIESEGNTVTITDKGLNLLIDFGFDISKDINYEKEQFKKKWSWCIEHTFHSRFEFEMGKLIAEIRDLTRKAYVSRENFIGMKRGIRKLGNKWSKASLTKEERAYLDHPLIYKKEAHFTNEEYKILKEEALNPELLEDLSTEKDNGYCIDVNMISDKEKRALGDKTIDAIETHIKNPYGVNLFDIWKENIAGPRHGIRAKKREKVEFLEYMMKMHKISYEPKHSEIFENYKNLAFSLGMLRPNKEAHIYLKFSFNMRPLKSIIKEYFDIAAITGEYDILLNRFPPYHTMLNLAPKPGERTKFDMRFDFRPITIPLNLKYSFAIELPKTQTRRDERYISIPALKDEKEETIKLKEIENLENKLKNIFPERDYLKKIELGEDGKVYYANGSKHKEEIVFYGGKRASYLSTEDLINLRKATSNPSRSSGLIVRFNLFDPVITLLRGIRGHRPCLLDEVIYLMKCLDIYQKEASKKPDERRKLNEIIDTVFDDVEVEGVSQKNSDFIEELERIRFEDPSEDVWLYLIQQLAEGKNAGVMSTLCRQMTEDGFEMVFSLWPLITGTELNFEKIKKGEWERPKSLTILPLIKNLKEILEDLLHDVFTKHLKISAATKDARSEPKLCELIVDECLKMPFDKTQYAREKERFKKRLKGRLRRHYTLHYHFLQEFYQSTKGTADILWEIDRLDMTDEQFEQRLDLDTNGIINLIEKARKRLFDRTISYRLLSFIDPKSVEVLVGDFQYDGVEEEETFLKAQRNLQKDLAEKARQKDKAMADAERKKQREIQELKIKIETNKIKEIKEIEHKIEVAKKKKELLLEEKYNQALETGELEQYVNLALYYAYNSKEGKEVTVQDIEKILNESDSLFAILDKETYKTREYQRFKQELLYLIKGRKGDISEFEMKFLMASLFDKELKDVLGAEIYEKLSRILLEELKKHGINPSSFRFQLPDHMEDDYWDD